MLRLDVLLGQHYKPAWSRKSASCYTLMFLLNGAPHRSGGEAIVLFVSSHASVLFKTLP